MPAEYTRRSILTVRRLRIRAEVVWGSTRPRCCHQRASAPYRPFCSRNTVYAQSDLDRLVALDHTSEPGSAFRAAGGRWRVLLVTDCLENGGAERQLALLARKLPPQWEVRVFSLASGPFAEFHRKHGVSLQVVERSWRFDPLPALRLLSTVVRWRPDVVHTWGWMSTLLSRWPCKVFRIPLIDGSIRSGIVAPRWSRSARFARRAATVIVANSEAGLRAWGVAGRRSRVIYNAMNPERLQDLVSEIPSPNHAVVDRVNVVMAARMVPGKDFRTVVDAARILGAQEGPEWRFVFAGNGPERDAILDYAVDLRAEGRVDWIDCGIEAVGVIASADFGVLLTVPGLHAEGCANVILEYMACGLPVVCSHDGGNPEIVVDGVNGLTVPPQDPSALASALMVLQTDGRLRRRICAANRSAIAQRFTVDRMVGEYVELYESLVQEHRRT